MISVRTHSVMDYVLGAFLVACPWIFGFAPVVAARDVYLALGILLVAYSLATRYPYSVFKWLPLGVHLSLDVTLGILLMLAPALFGYRETISGAIYALHFVLGLGVIGFVAFTDAQTRDRGMGEVIDLNQGRPTGFRRAA